MRRRGWRGARSWSAGWTSTARRWIPSSWRKRVLGWGLPEVEPVPEVDLRQRGLWVTDGGIQAQGALDEVVERSLRHAALWDEVKDSLENSAMALSGGQQQRLCIARAIAAATRTSS